MFSRRVLHLILVAMVATAVYFAFIRNANRGYPPGEFSQKHRSAGRRRGDARRNGPDQRWPRDQERRGGPSGEHSIPCSSQYFADWQQPGDAVCAVHLRNGFPEPDPACTPGGVNPSISTELLRDPAWRTRSVRNCESSEGRKHIAYRWYAVQKPRINSNQNQICELDHLVPLELGGADGLGNIWPECGPDAVTLNQRYFKRKDRVENFLAEQVKSGSMTLQDAQRGIAADWTQYMGQADAWCAQRGRC